MTVRDSYGAEKKVTVEARGAEKKVTVRDSYGAEKKVTVEARGAGNDGRDSYRAKR